MVSIIIPSYNSAEYLDRCIGSVLAQDSPDWELVLVDDGSTDGSERVYGKYAEADSRIRIVRQANGGVSAARNNGIRHSRGEWIAFVDSDDEVRPGYVSRMLAAATDCDMVMSGWDNRGTVTCPPDACAGREGFTDLLLSRQINYGYPWGKLFKASVVKDNGVIFPEGVTWAEDKIFFFRFLLHAKRIRSLAEPLYLYHSRPNSGVSRLTPYETDFKGYTYAYDLALELTSVFPKSIIKTFSPFEYLQRYVLSVMRNRKIDKRRKLTLLGQLRFDRRLMAYRKSNLRETVLNQLIIHRMWRTLFLLRK